MKNTTAEEILGEIQDSAALAKLQAMSRELVGIVLACLVCKDDDTVEMCMPGGETQLPEFCRAIRSTEKGNRQCRTCRSLIAMSAGYRGLTQYDCHGGVSILAVPARGWKGELSKDLVVSSCAFVRESHARGWKGARLHGISLGIAPAQFKRAYQLLPLVSDDKLPIAEAFMELAATMVGEIEHRVLTTIQSRELAWAMGYRGDPELLGQAFESELFGTGNFSVDGEDSKNSFTLAELVKSMVIRNPAMSYTVASIARAARMTPNHFSMLFHRETGKTFTDFLTEQRLELAKELLKDVRLSVSEVAHRAGFADPAYFSRRFKTRVGMSPTEWRGGH